MTSSDTNPEQPLPLEVLERIDAVCLQFEKAWRSGDSLRIEDLLGDFHDRERRQLLFELLLIEIDYRIRQEPARSLDDYRDRFPRDCQTVDAAIERFSDVATHTPDAGPQHAVAQKIRYLGNYELLDEIARGGMGIVYKAKQSPLGRTVAVKMMLSGHMANGEQIARFEREAKLAARLQHPHIVAVHEVGRHAGLPYFSMDYVDGRSLSEIVRENPLPAADSARYLLVSAQTVHRAHEEGILHRDLKPSNILIDREDRVRITDFGLAKYLDADETLTESGGVMGTPSYMPPEQANGNSARIGVHSDVYSLGAILYELLIGRPPFAAATVLETLHQVEHQDPIAPRLINPSIPRDLETICLKCLEKEPHRRYATAEQLADDLQRYLEGKPIIARPIGRLGRLMKWAKRQPVVATLLVLLMTSLAVGSGVSTYLWYVAEERASAEATAKDDARMQANAFQRLAARSLFDHSALEFTEGRVLSANRDLLRAWTTAAADDPLRSSYLNVLVDRVTQGNRQIAPPLRHANRVIHVAFSPDGERLATASWDGMARLWDARSGAPLGDSMRHQGFVNHVAFSPDGERLATASGDRTARLWDARRGTLLGDPMQHEDRVVHVAFSPDGERLATASWDGTARLWDARSGAPLGEPMRHGWLSFVGHVAFSPDGERLATTSEDGMARLWDARTGAPLGRRLLHQSRVTYVAFSPGGERMATASTDGTARLWDAQSGAPLGDPMRHEDDVAQVAFSPDGERLATASTDGTARLWDARNGAPLEEPLEHDSVVNHVAFSPDGQRLATASTDGSARLWDARNGAPLGEPMQHEGPVVHVTFSPDGKRLATASWAFTARLWDARNGAPLVDSMQHEGPVVRVAFSPDGERLATASNDRTARLWDTDRGAPLGEPMRHGSFVWHVAFSPDGERLATASEDGTARLWDARTGAPLGRPMRHEGHEVAVMHVAFSPDGERLATASQDGTARLWDARSGAPLGASLRHEHWVVRVAFSPDGERLATASWDGTARLWEARSGAALGDSMRHQGSVIHVAFSPDGERLVTASQDGTARLWDARTGAPLGEPMRHEGAIAYVEFSPDGERIATASDDKISLWDARRGAPLGDPMRHEAPVVRVAFTPDGERLATASNDRTARLWDVGSGTPLGGPMRHEGPVVHVAFSPDGERLATASGDGTAQLWDAVNPDLEAVPQGQLRLVLQIWAGWSIDDAGNTRPLSAEDAQELRRQLGGFDPIADSVNGASGAGSFDEWAELNFGLGNESDDLVPE